MYQDILFANKNSIIEKYNSGIGMATIAKEYGCNSGTILYYFKQWGVTTRKPLGRFTCKEKHDEIIKLYHEDNSIYKISQIVGIESSPIIRYLNSLGYDTSKFSTAREVPLKNHTEDIIKLYKEGKSITDIAEIYEAAIPSIKDILYDNNIELVSEHKKYSFIENYFDEIDSPNKAYILGFAYADGNVISKPGKHVFRISITDYDILEAMRKELEYTGPLYDRGKRTPNHQNQWCLQISSTRICESLIKWGCVPNKTFKIDKIPPIPKELVRHFVRGYFDGDGSVSKQGKASMCGNKSFLEEIAALVGVEINMYDRHPERGTTNRSANFSKNISSHKFLEYIYKDVDGLLYLERKRYRYLNPEKKIHNSEERKARYYADKAKRALIK